jgi:predicted nucleotidyltransferase
MIDRLRAVVEADSRIVFAFVFGSSARGTSHSHSDVDVAIELRPDVHLGALEIGGLVSALESAAARPVDLVLLNEAPSPVAYRVFRDGHLMFVRDKAALAARRANAILEYLDFKPVEDLCAAGVLARHGRQSAARG